MIWLALLCLTVASEYIAGVFVEQRPGLAAIFFMSGSLGLCFALWKATPVNGWKKRLTLTLVNSLMIIVSTTVLQFLFFRLYFWLAPHFHAIPLLSAPLDFLLRAIGHETTRHSEFIYLQTFQTVLPISITFEKLGVPALCSFFLMGWVTFAWFGKKHWLRLLLELGAIISVFAIFRLLLLILLFADWNKLAIFWNPVLIGVSFLPLIAILTYFYPTINIEGYLGVATFSVTKQELWHYSIMILCFLLIVVALGMEDPGRAKSGQVLIDEVHSNWEWTTLPFNKEDYGKQTTYNYYCFRTWLDHYYHVSVNIDQELTAAFLSQYSLLIIKTPTSPFSEAELEAIQKFVRDGGGLFLIGDHTNLYGMTTYINPVSERFGITFLPDDTFELSTGAPTVYQPPQLFAHPTVHHIQNFRFMTSCTLASPLFHSRGIMKGAQLGRENADYSHVNFFGNMEADINDEYGLFTQATARKYGKGRVVAFSDSTVFSNFTMFYEGRPELAIGIMEYLNRTNSRIYKVITTVLLIGAAFGLFLIFLKLKQNSLSIPLIITVTSMILIIAIFIGNWLSTGLNTLNYKKPKPHTKYTRITFDREISYYYLPGMLQFKPVKPELHFDAFYTSVQRLGHYPALATDIKSAIDTSHVVVIINPRKELGEGKLSLIQKFLQEGGKLLVIENSAAHTGYTQQYQRLTQQVSENITVPIEFQAGDVFRIEKNKVGSGDFVIVFGADQLSHLYMGATHSNPTDKEKLKYGLAYFLFEEVLKVSTQGEQL